MQLLNHGKAHGPKFQSLLETNENDLEVMLQVVTGSLPEYLDEGTKRFDMISISNVMDWMPLEDAIRLVAALKHSLKEKGKIVTRRMHGPDRRHLFEKAGFVLYDEPDDSTRLYQTHVWQLPDHLKNSKSDTCSDVQM